MSTDQDQANNAEKVAKIVAEAQEQVVAFRKTNLELLENAKKMIEADPDAEVLILIARSQGNGIGPLWNFRTPVSLVFALEFFKQTFFTDFLMKRTPTPAANGPRIVSPLDGQANSKPRR